MNLSQRTVADCALGCSPVNQWGSPPAGESVTSTQHLILIIHPGHLLILQLKTFLQRPSSSCSLINFEILHCPHRCCRSFCRIRPPLEAVWACTDCAWFTSASLSYWICVAPVGELQLNTFIILLVQTYTFISFVYYRLYYINSITEECLCVLSVQYNWCLSRYCSGE